MVLKINSAPRLYGHFIRRFFAGALLLLMTAVLLPATVAAGQLHTQSWFKPTTGDLRRDLAAAQAEGKRLTLIWEQVGCVYCKKMHDVNFQHQEIVDLITEKFYPVQMNLRGSRKITDFDGEEMVEADLAGKHGVNGTPVIEFRDNQANEVFRLPGYAKPFIFMSVFDYVASNGYEDSKLIPWLKAKYLVQGKRSSDG